MKLGILTFHSQLNYGGVLQCWALKTALEGMGHEVVVVDRWLDPGNSSLNGPFARFGIKALIGIVLRMLTACKNTGRLIRIWRTRRFVRSLNLTSYHFYDWNELRSLTSNSDFQLDIDMLVVGSDQVWHGGALGWYPNPYLLEGAPRCRAIAYAASFGMDELPQGIDYAKGFSRFSEISVREACGVRLVKNAGYPRSVEHVVDPTLLIDPALWKAVGSEGKVMRRLVCYFLTEDVKSAVPIIEKWAKRNRWSVEIVCDNYQRQFPRSVRQLAIRAVEVVRELKPSPVKVRTTYGPWEFVRSFSRAEACITDSFHAVMFSSIYKLNARFLAPRESFRREMFARIEEFSRQVISGNFLVDGLETALASLARDERIVYNEKTIEERRRMSQDWLVRALRK